MKELINIQRDLRAPKGQFNQFGRYKYRSCEDILEAVKPLLAANSCTLTITDTMEAVGTRIYVRATATLTNAAGETETTQAFAREEDTKKGMDASQVTGAASSYARKYALNGLFCIDDTKDSDATNHHGKDEAPATAAPRPAASQSAAPATPAATQPVIDLTHALAQVAAATSEEVLNALVRASRPLYTNVQFQEAVKAKREQLKAATNK